jgi:phosphoribosylformylglycinamidine (FGAM) synthase-like amidotransferase family enzyme
MNLKQKVAAILLALVLAPVYVGTTGVAIADSHMEFNATVVSKEEKSIKVKTKDGEKTVLIGKSTKGVDNAKEGSKVTIKYMEKDGQIRASEINPR